MGKGMENFQKCWRILWIVPLLMDFPSGKQLMSCMRDMLGHVYNLSINSSRTQSRRQSLVVNARIDPICLFRKYFFYIHTYRAFKDPVGILNDGVTHCLYLVLNTQETSHFYWHQFWDKNDGENICHWNYFQIPWALSELPVNWSGLTSLFGWFGRAS